MKHNKAHLKLLPLLLAGLFSSQSHAAGFAIQENSASGLGNAFAGGAAVSEDASVVWYNPAAMSKLQGSNLTGVLHIIKTSSNFNDDGSTKPTGLTNSGNGGDSGGTFFIPNLYLTLPITNQLSFGMGINAPFGLVTKYEDTWVGRAQGIKSDIKTVNLNPALSWKINDTISLGAGLNFQRLNAELTSTAAAALGGGLVTIKADDNAYGYNFGALFSPTEQTQIGLHYRSAIKYDLRGRANFDGASSALSVDIKSDLKIPSMLSLSALQKLSQQWDVMADATYTKWSSIPELRYIRTANASGGAAFGAANTTLDAIALNWKNTWRTSIGANYRYSDSIKFRAGIAYDQTPVPDAAHTIVRLTDGDRTWLSLGVQYALQKTLKFDFGYTYLKLRTARMDSSTLTNSASKGTLLGSFDGDTHILSAQLNYQF